MSSSAWQTWCVVVCEKQVQSCCYVDDMLGATTCLEGTRAKEAATLESFADRLVSSCCCHLESLCDIVTFSFIWARRVGSLLTPDFISQGWLPRPFGFCFNCHGRHALLH